MIALTRVISSSSAKVVSVVATNKRLHTLIHFTCGRPAVAPCSYVSAIICSLLSSASNMTLNHNATTGAANHTHLAALQLRCPAA
jgi:hypothetical protein